MPGWGMAALSQPRGTFGDVEEVDCDADVRRSGRDEMLDAGGQGFAGGQVSMAGELGDGGSNGLFELEKEGACGVGARGEKGGRVGDAVLAGEADAQAHVVRGEQLLRAELKGNGACVAGEDGAAGQ